MPQWQEAGRRGLLGPMTKCDTCIAKRSPEQRQLLGCAYTPPPAGRLSSFVKPWQGLGYSGDEPSVCPGYTTQLPEVIEIARARLHWSKGSLAAFCPGEPPSALLIGIEILEGAVCELIDWKSTPKAQGGGGA